jgi:hypothetical protein
MAQQDRRAGAGRSGGAWRTGGAIVALLLFWAALARSLWPEFAPALLRIVQMGRGVDAAVLQTEHMTVRNASRIDEAALHDVLTRLEADYAAIEAAARDQAGAGEGMATRVSVMVADGAGPALSDGAGLSLFHDGGRIDLSTAPFFLALLREGTLSMSGLSPFVDGGYAVYLCEEAGRAGALLGQSSDAWVALLRGAGAYVPLAEAWDAGLPRGEGEMGVALRVLLEGGSFVRWVAETYGSEAVAALRDGVPVKEAIGVPLAEAEGLWTGELARRGMEPQPCREALPEASPLWGYCGALVPAG